MASAEYQRAWRALNPGKQAQYSKKYADANRDVLNARARESYRSNGGKEKSRRWAKANPDRVRAAKARYRQKPDTRGKERASDRAWRAANGDKLLVMQARARAKKLGLDFDISYCDVAIPVLCPVLGIPLVGGGGKPKPNSPTLDRIDNARGYVRGNVMVISYRANTMKNAATFDELRRFVAFYGALLNEHACDSACEKSIDRDTREEFPLFA